MITALLLMIAGFQTAWGQGFRVYKSDGTIMQFSLRTDSIVFYDGIGTDMDFGPYTPVNQMIVGVWYKSVTDTVTFHRNGTTDYIEGATYEFMPYQGSLIIYDADSVATDILKVHKVTAEKMIVSTLGGSFSIWSREPVDERLPMVIPDSIRNVVEAYIPIYDGVTPPNIEGCYYLSPHILIASSRNNDTIGKEYDAYYYNFSKQDMATNSIDYIYASKSGTDWAKSINAFISGYGNNFTIYSDVVGESNGVSYKEVYVISGTKTSTGIKNLTMGFYMKEKGLDPNNKVVDPGTYRFFHDSDGMSELTSWPFGSQFDARRCANEKRENDLPDIHSTK